MAAFAGSAYSDYGYFSVNGINYKNRASVSTDSSTHKSYATTTLTSTNKSAPAGWMGTNARLFNSSGTLLKEGGFSYTTSTTSTTVSSSPNYTNKGTYRSYGVTRAWTGSTYQNYYTFLSPFQNA